jgi:hypothetical protein
MSEFPDSFEPLDLPDVPDLPRRGTAHGDPGTRSSPPRPGIRHTVRSRPMRTHGARRCPRAAGPDIPQGPSRHRSRCGKSREGRAAGQPFESGRSRSVVPVSPDTVAERRSSEAGSGFDGRMQARSGGYSRAPRRQGTASLLADPRKPAQFWAERNETRSLIQVPVHMADENSRQELAATALGDLNGGGPTGRR